MTWRERIGCSSAWIRSRTSVPGGALGRRGLDLDGHRRPLRSDATDRLRRRRRERSYRRQRSSPSSAPPLPRIEPSKATFLGVVMAISIGWSE
jgi:hypothetical protein